jgi:hypothetical protein
MYEPDFDGADLKEREFYFWVGRCIKSWAEFDDSLFGLCCVTLYPLYPKARAIYWRISSIDTRIQTVSEFVEVHIQPDGPISGGKRPADLKTWDQLVQRATALLKFRNFVAHAPPWTSYSPGDFLPNGRRIVIPTWHTKQHRADRERKAKEHGPSDFAAMKEHTATVKTLADDVRSFAIQLERQQLERRQQQTERERGLWLAAQPLQAPATPPRPRRASRKK